MLVDAAGLPLYTSVTVHPRAFALLVLFAAVGAAADDMEPLRAVTAVEGAAFVQMQDGDLDPVNVNELALITAGQRLLTAMGRAEFTPTPGTSVSLDVFSEVEIVAASGQSVTLRLHHGSIIVDAHKIGKGATTLTILVGNAMTILSKGLFRFDSTGKEARLQVWKGETTLAARGEGYALKKKDAADITAARVEISRLEHFTDDELTAWRRKRRTYSGADVYLAENQLGSAESLSDRSEALRTPEDSLPDVGDTQ